MGDPVFRKEDSVSRNRDQVCRKGDPVPKKGHPNYCYIEKGPLSWKPGPSLQEPGSSIWEIGSPIRETGPSIRKTGSPFREMIFFFDFWRLEVKNDNLAKKGSLKICPRVDISSVVSVVKKLIKFNRTFKGRRYSLLHLYIYCVYVSTTRKF